LVFPTSSQKTIHDNGNLAIAYGLSLNQTKEKTRIRTREGRGEGGKKGRREEGKKRKKERRFHT